MAPPLLPRPPEAVTEAAAEADKDVQPPPADEDVVLWAGDEPDTSETSVEVDMGESICWGPLLKGVKCQKPARNWNEKSWEIGMKNLGKLAVLTYACNQT
jgi:hypothetical protein